MPPAAATSGIGRSRVALGYAVALALLVVATGLVWLLLGRQQSEDHWVRHSDEVLLELDELLGDIVDSETAERGFVISGQPSFLQPYEDAKGRLARDLAALEALTADSAAQRERLAGAARVARAELTAFERVIKLRDVDLAAAMASIAAGGDKQFTDEVRGRVGEMKHAELALLAQRQARAARASRRTVVLVTAVLGCMLLALAWAAWTAQLSVARRQLAEQEAARLEATLELDRERRQRDHFREQFLGIVGHDLRSPISAIAIEAQLLRQPQDAGAQRQTGERILAGTERMVRMVNQLLDVTRSRLGGGIPIVPRELALRELVEAVVAEQARAHPGRVVLEASDDALGRFDCDRMAQVVSNLVANALEHGEGAVQVRLDVGAAEVTLSVHNGGEPIPAGELDHLFEPFRRGTGRGEADGLGLGLFITREIVSGHHGQIAVTSTAAGGTRFTVSLPR